MSLLLFFFGRVLTRSRKFRIIARKIEFGVFRLFRIRKKIFSWKKQDFDEFPYFFRIWFGNKFGIPKWRHTKRCHGCLHYDRKFEIFIFLIGYINVNKVFFGLIISYLRIKSCTCCCVIVCYIYNQHTGPWSIQT
jgi:hypothetical protein